MMKFRRKFDQRLIPSAPKSIPLKNFSIYL